MKVPNWLAKARLKPGAPAPAAQPGIRSVMLGGVETVLEGAADDPYFGAVEHHAAALDGLAALVTRQSTHRIGD